jgi:hypothetical protein
LGNFEGFLHPKAFTPQVFQTSENCNNASIEVKGRSLTYIFHLVFHEIEKLPKMNTCTPFLDVFSKNI